MEIYATIDAIEQTNWMKLKQKLLKRALERMKDRYERDTEQGEVRRKEEVKGKERAG